MYTARIWQKQINNNNKILYEDIKALIKGKKDEQGKTKTDLIREYCEYKGDRWKYLINHPKTRMALCTSGDAIWNKLNSVNFSFTAFNNTVINQSGYLTNGSMFSIPNNYADFYVRTVQSVRFPIQFSAQMPSSSGIVSGYNFGFISSQIYLGSNPLLNNNPFNFSNDQGFCLYSNTISTQCYYA